MRGKSFSWTLGLAELSVNSLRGAFWSATFVPSKGSAKIVSEERFPKVSPKSAPEDCCSSPRVSCMSVWEKSLTRGVYKSVFVLKRVSCTKKSLSEEQPRRVSCKSLLNLQKHVREQGRCLVGVSWKSLSQECPWRASSNIASQECSEECLLLGVL